MPDSNPPKGTWLSRLFGRNPAPAGTFASQAQLASASPSQPPTAMPVPGEVVTGKRSYRLVSPLGEGAFGTVFLATPVDPPTNGAPRELAIKFLSAKLTREVQLKTLRGELSSMLAIRDRHIPQVYDWALEGTHPFVAMEYFPNGSLLDLLEVEGTLPEGQELDLLEDLIASLSAAQQACVLHLDIKPANVLMRADGGYALTDFGTAQAAMASDDMVRHPGRGTRGYQAPEQTRATASQLDVRTDLYGVGATVWAACTGIDLASPRGQRLLQASKDQPTVLPPVSRHCPTAPVELDRLLAPLLARDPTQRPAHPADVSAQISLAREHRERGVQRRGRAATTEEAETVQSHLIDPLWSWVVQSQGGARLHGFSPGERLVAEGDASFHALVLLSGHVRVERRGTYITTVQREGSFLGEVAALTGAARTADLIAVGEVWAMILDTVELERLVTKHPAVGVRLIREMAERLAAHAGNQEAHSRP